MAEDASPVQTVVDLEADPTSSTFVARVTSALLAFGSAGDIFAHLALSPDAQMAQSKLAVAENAIAVLYDHAALKTAADAELTKLAAELTQLIFYSALAWEKLKDSWNIILDMITTKDVIWLSW